jgi:hypothetical protein
MPWYSYIAENEYRRIFEKEPFRERTEPPPEKSAYERFLEVERQLQPEVQRQPIGTIEAPGLPRPTAPETATAIADFRRAVPSADEVAQTLRERVQDLSLERLGTQPIETEYEKRRRLGQVPNVPIWTRGGGEPPALTELTREKMEELGGYPLLAQLLESAIPPKAREWIRENIPIAGPIIEPILASFTSPVGLLSVAAWPAASARMAAYGIALGTAGKAIEEAGFKPEVEIGPTTWGPAGVGELVGTLAGPAVGPALERAAVAGVKKLPAATSAAVAEFRARVPPLLAEEAGGGPLGLKVPEPGAPRAIADIETDLALLRSVTPRPELADAVQNKITQLEAELAQAKSGARVTGVATEAAPEAVSPEVAKFRAATQAAPEAVSPEVAKFRAATQAAPEVAPQRVTQPPAEKAIPLSQAEIDEAILRGLEGRTLGVRGPTKAEALERWRAQAGEGAVPPAEPPKPPTQLGMEGMPPEEPKGPRLPTMRDVEARSKPVPPEVRAELGGQPPAMAFELEPFDTVAERWGDRFVENWWTKAEDLLGGKIKAVARTPEEIAVRRAFNQRDLYASTQGDSMRAGVLEWRGRNSKVLGLNAKGQATAVKIAEGAEIPKGLEQRLMHIVEHPEKYVLTAEQQRAIKEATDRFTMMLRRQQAEGVNIREWQESYWHRIVTKRPAAEPGRMGVGRRLGARPPAARMRVFGDVEDAWSRGYRYANDIDAMMAYGQDAADAIADRNTVRTVQNLGFKPSEKVDPAIIQELREAREGYKAARAAASKKGATTAEKATALEAETRLDTAMRTMRLESRRWAERQPKVFGRIVSPEVAEEFSRYVGDLPGGTIDQAFQLLRANMIWGDLSAAGVQTQQLIWRDPVTWAKATAYSVRAMASEPTSYILKNIDAIESGTRFGAIRAPEEFLLRTGRGIAYRFGKLPGVKQTQRAFEWDIFVAQTERWKAVQRMAKTPDDLLELASVIRAQTGTALTPGLTTAQAKALGRTWFAGRFLTSTLAVFKNATRGGVAGHEARRTLAQVFGGVAATTAAVNVFTTGKVGNFTDPDKPGFLGIRVGEGYVYPYGPFQPLLVAAARSARVPLKLAQGQRPSNRDLQAWPRFLEGKLSLPYRVTAQALEALGVPLEAIRGEPYESPKIEGVGGWVEQLGEYMPIGPSQAIQGIRQGFYAAALEPLGAKTTPLSPAMRRNEARDQAAQAMFPGKNWADLLQGEQNQVREANPDLRQLEAAATERAAERGYEYSQRTQAYNARKTELADEGERALASDPTGKQWAAWRKTAGIKLNERWEALTQQYGIKEEPREPEFIEDRLAERYWNLEPDANNDGIISDDEWAAYDAQRQGILQEAEAAGVSQDYIEHGYRGKMWPDHPQLQAIEEQYQQAKEVAAEYYDIPAKIGMSAQAQDEVRGIVAQAQGIARANNIPFHYALLNMDVPDTLKFRAMAYQKLPANPARKLYRYQNPDKWRLFVTFYSEVPLETEPEMATAGVR